VRRLAVFAGSFAVGIFLAQYALPHSWLLPCAAAAFVLACVRLLLRGDWGKRLLLIGTGLAIGLGYNWLYARQVQLPMEALAGKEFPVVMTLQDYAVATDYGAKVTVRVDGLPAKAVYYGNAFLLELEPGQIMTDTVYLQSAAKIRDTEITTFTSKGVFLLAYGRGEPVVESGSAGAFRWWPLRLGRAMREQVKLLHTDDTAGFLTAILTGEKSGLSEQAGNDLSEAGIYHILAVSGMHCGFLLVMVGLLLGRHRHRLLAICTIPVLIFYALMTGCSPSVVRACVMLSLLVAAPLFRRDSDGPTSLTAALLLILLQNPFAAASISLQLSFTAMAGLLWLTPKVYAYLVGGGKRGRVFTFVAASFSATMGALVFSTPLTAYYFGIFVLIAPLSNLLCLWAIGIVFTVGLISVALSFLVQPLAAVLAIVPGVLIRYILGTAHLLAKIPYHAVYFTNPYLKYWLAFAYLLFAAAYFGKGRRRYAIAVLSTAVTLAITVHLGASRYGGRLETIVLDVGQGQSVVLASEGEYALVDCGSANSWYDAGTTAADQLLTMGCRRLDYLILSHYDSDHINGVTGLLSRLEVETLLVPPGVDEDGLRSLVETVAESYGVELRLVDETETIDLGATTLMVFPPVGKVSGDNEQGISLLVTLDQQDMLITGDMDRATEKRLLNTYNLPDMEVLVAGHHGSKAATSEKLLDTLAPETVCISVGDNSYGHPADEMLRRLAERGCAVYRTDLHGNIRLSWN